MRYSEESLIPQLLERKLILYLENTTNENRHDKNPNIFMKYYSFINLSNVISDSSAEKSIIKPLGSSSIKTNLSQAHNDGNGFQSKVNSSLNIL